MKTDIPEKVKATLNDIGMNVKSAGWDCHGTFVLLHKALEKVAAKQEDDKLTLSYILNIIDGIRETPGRIMIITSNYYNKLDKALIRPGRIDITLQLKNASVKTISDFYNHYYEKNIPNHIYNTLRDDVISPADLVNIRLNSKNDEEYLNNLLLRFC